MGTFGTLFYMDVKAGAYRDVFTAFPKVPI
jgi:hypothetical protein